MTATDRVVRPAVAAQCVWMWHGVRGGCLYRLHHHNDPRRYLPSEDWYSVRFGAISDVQDVDYLFLNAHTQLVVVLCHSGFSAVKVILSFVPNEKSTVPTPVAASTTTMQLRSPLPYFYSSATAICAVEFGRRCGSSDAAREGDQSSGLVFVLIATEAPGDKYTLREPERELLLYCWGSDEPEATSADSFPAADGLKLLARCSLPNEFGCVRRLRAVALNDGTLRAVAIVYGAEAVIAVLIESSAAALSASARIVLTPIAVVDRISVANGVAQNFALAPAELIWR